MKRWQQIVVICLLSLIIIIAHTALMFSLGVHPVGIGFLNYILANICFLVSMTWLEKTNEKT